MGRVLTNNTGLQVAVEAAGTPGTLPGSPAWEIVERNELGAYGTNISTVARNPISKKRRRQKGTATDKDSNVEMETDLTLSAVEKFLPGFMFSIFKGQAPFSPTAVTSTGYTVASGGALANGLLVYARGFSNAANNGLKLLAGTSTGTEIKTTGLVAEASPPAGARVDLVGVQGASGDIQIDANGDLIATTLNFTTLGLTVGQFIFIGGNQTAERFALDISSGQNFGYARVKAIAAGKLTLDKQNVTFAVDNGSGKTIRVFFGRFVRDVNVDHADFLETTYQFEAGFPGLGAGGATEYEYSIGNYANEMAFELPLTDKAKLSLGFVGKDTEDPTTSRKTNASAAVSPYLKEAFNTSLDIARLRVQKEDETGISTDFKSVTLTLKNNAAGERVLGTLGPKYINYGNFEVDFDAQCLFTDKVVPAAIKANTTLQTDFGLRNNDGAMVLDVASHTLGGGDREFPVNESVLINTTGAAFEDAVLGYTLGATVFAHIPAR